MDQNIQPLILEEPIQYINLLEEYYDSYIGVNAEGGEASGVNAEQCCASEIK